MFNEGQIHAEGFADISDSAFGSIGDHTGCQGGAMAAIFFIDILNHFFAAFVLKVDINVWRLITFFGDKPFKQQVRLGGVNFGYFETIADGAIGRRAAALTQNLGVAGKLHDVEYGQKIILVL